MMKNWKGKTSVVAAASAAAAAAADAMDKNRISTATTMYIGSVIFLFKIYQ